MISRKSIAANVSGIGEEGQVGNGRDDHGDQFAGGEAAINLDLDIIMFIML
jgi:hypothetical protein